MRSVISKLSVVAVALMLAAVALGQDKAPGGVRGEVLSEIDGLEKKYLGLAEAVPQDKLGWRPAEGVRSFSEVFMHVAGANYRLPGFIGVKAPEGLPQDMEKITSKADIVKHLKGSFDHIRNSVMNMSDADVEKTSKMFGRDRTYREIGFFMAGHMHEHLGQLIAYSRMNGITPPWSQG